MVVGRRAAKLDPAVLIFFPVDRQRCGHFDVAVAEIFEFGFPVFTSEVDEDGSQNRDIVEATLLGRDRFFGDRFTLGRRWHLAALTETKASTKVVSHATDVESAA